MTANTISQVFNLVLTILSIVIAFRAIVYKTRSNIYREVVRMVDSLEGNSELDGYEKMEFIISYIIDLTPRIVKVVFNDKVIEQIASSIFKDMRAYSDKRAKNKLGVNINTAAKILDSLTETESSNKGEGI